MPKLIIEPTATAQWQRLVQEAARSATLELDTALESYLVFLLNRNTRDTHALSGAMAMAYLRAQGQQGQQQVQQLRDVGDRCLLLSGLFPHRAQRRHVRISYFVHLGRSAYQLLAERLNHSVGELYQSLSQAFVSLTDVLLAMRSLEGPAALTPIEAMDLWQDARSQQALRALQRKSHGLPCSNYSAKRH